MNLLDIWSGYDYAWFQDKGRNDNYRAHAPRVKVIRAFKEEEYGRDRAAGYAEVMFLHDDGTPKLKDDGSQIIRKVRARDIAMRWEEYAEERDYRRVQEEKRKREREEREAEETRIRTELTEALIEKYGIPKEAVYNITSTGIHLSRSVLERELGLVS